MGNNKKTKGIVMSNGIVWNGQTSDFLRTGIKVLYRIASELGPDLAARWASSDAQMERTFLEVFTAPNRLEESTPEGAPSLGESSNEVLSLTLMEKVECDAIIEALREKGGNKSATAKYLGIARQTLYKKIKAYGVNVCRPCVIAA
jgi:DNA-binding NtrC family response regulator